METNKPVFFWMSFDERQYLRRSIQKMLEKEYILLLFSGSIEKLNPRNYFNQLNYIEGTYIRKDKFAQMLERKSNEAVDNIVLDLKMIPLRPLSEDFLAELRRMAREVGFMPIDTSKK